MAIHAIIFDIGGVLVEIDWERYREDQASEIMSETLWPYEQMNERMAQLLKRLRPRYKLAAIGNGSSREVVNRRFKLNSLFDLMVFDSEEGIYRPDPRIYQLTLARLEVQANQAVFVDDKEQHVAAARQLGIHAIHFQHARQAIAELEAILQREQDSPLAAQ